MFIQCTIPSEMGGDQDVQCIIPSDNFKHTLEDKPDDQSRGEYLHWPPADHKQTTPEPAQPAAPETGLQYIVCPQHEAP
ncbi:hypothetical protein PoB_004729500 [Plakobranchus ocellatus]|uniref:ELM2 domain-containing protein n=1 Tax=Plakobranchus ocellatus TaxID=259542 RepID=A0AAV4BNW8_9GAST|nr:hypothetical protein PoB_004729500 [Plakobranchus ocellatus]